MFSTAPRASSQQGQIEHIYADDGPSSKDEVAAVLPVPGTPLRTFWGQSTHVKRMFASVTAASLGFEWLASAIGSHVTPQD